MLYFTEPPFNATKQIYMLIVELLMGGYKEGVILN